MAKNTVKANVAVAPVAKATPIKNEVTSELAIAWMEAFKDANNRDIQLSEKVVISVIERAGTQWATMDDDGKLDLLLKSETMAKTVMVADPGITTLIKKMDEQFHNEVAACIGAKRKDKASAVFMLAQFRRIFTETELNGCPMPGWDEKDAADTGYRPEKRSVKDSTGTPITTNWGNDFVAAMPEGKEAQDVLDTISKEEKAPGTTAYKSKSKDEIADLKASATQDRNALRSLVRRALKLHHRLVAIGKLNAVGIRFISGSKAKGITMPTKYALGEEIGEHFKMVSSGPKPLWIYDAEDSSKGRDFSVTQILSMSPELARLGAGGGTMADLVATAGKGAEEEFGAEGGDGADMATDVAQATASQFYNFLNKRENMAIIRKKIANRAKDAEGNDWLDLICSIHLETKAIYTMNKDAYDALQQREDVAAA